MSGPPCIFFMAQLFPSIIFLNGEALNTIQAEAYCVWPSKGFQWIVFSSKIPVRQKSFYIDLKVTFVIELI